MNAGSRETPIIVERPVVTRDPVYQNEVVAWEPWPDEVWASADFKSGREFYEDGALITQNAMTFTIDWLDGEDIREDMRIICEGQTYNIKAIDHDRDLKRRKVIQAISGINETQK